MWILSIELLALAIQINNFFAGSIPVNSSNSGKFLEFVLHIRYKNLQAANIIGI